MRQPISPVACSGAAMCRGSGRPVACDRAGTATDASPRYWKRASGSMPSVLICDDALYARRILGGVIEGAGYRVLGYAADGLQAVARYARLRPDLVTLNLVMPGIGGLDALARILEIDPGACVVMCSAVCQEPLIDAALQGGARAFEFKPYVPSHLLATLATALSRTPSLRGGGFQTPATGTAERRLASARPADM